MRTTDLTIDSRYRDISAHPHTDKYDISLKKLADPVKNIHSIEIIDIYIPETQRLIDKHNNIITVNQTDYTLTPKDYTDSDTLIDDIHTLLGEPIIVTMSSTDGKVCISQTPGQSVSVSVSFKGDLHNILGLSKSTIQVQTDASVYGTRPVNILKTPYVFIGLENVHFDERQLVSPISNEYFGKYFFPDFLPRNMSKQIRVFDRNDGIRALDRLRISILNPDNSLYLTHDTEHTFTLRIKMTT